MYKFEVNRRLIIILFMLLNGCSTIYDKTAPNPKQMKEDAFKDIYFPEVDDDVNDFQYKEKKKEKPPINKNFYKKVSINVSKNTDISEAILKLAKTLKINVKIEGGIKGGVVFSASGEEFLSVIKDLSSMLGWWYTIKDNGLIIKNDAKYFKNYHVPFLNISREMNSSISTNNNLLSSNDISDQKTTSDIESNGSSSVVSTSSTDNFWSELEINLKALLSPDGEITIHKQAGVIAINANHAVHKRIKKYLKLLKRNCNAQVVIEAKILEVNLSKDFMSGINWSSLRKHFVLGVPMGDSLNQEAGFDSSTGSANLFTIGSNNPRHTVSTILHMIEKFGSIRTLSNPRITIMNNQTGIIKVAKQEVYFNLRYDNRYQNTLTGSNRESIYSNIKTVPVGLVFSVHPVVNMETGEITLMLRPTISKITKYKDDPSVSFLKANILKNTLAEGEVIAPNISNMVPVVEIREMDSVLTVKSGEIVVMGGLMSESSNILKSGLPHVSSINLLGDVFSANGEENSVSEIVIFLRARIVNNSRNTVSRKDKSLYNRIAVDNRPLVFENGKNAQKDKKPTKTKSDKAK